MSRLQNNTEQKTLIFSPIQSKFKPKKIFRKFQSRQPDCTLDINSILRGNAGRGSAAKVVESMSDDGIHNDYYLPWKASQVTEHSGQSK